MFLRAGLGRPNERLGLWLTLGAWPLPSGICWRLDRSADDAVGTAADSASVHVLAVPPADQTHDRAIAAVARLHRAQLKSGRTLSDAVMGGIESSDDPLKEAMGRVQRNVQLGVNLPDAVSDFAELYEQDELRMFALGLKVNHRYGGNASELLENLIKLIRERDQGARQLRALTGETRMTAWVLGSLPVILVGYFMLTNPVTCLACGTTAVGGPC
jgi:tight adherence protein B